MQFSRKTDYALILLSALKSTFASGDFLPLRSIAERERLPPAFLEKIAAALKKHKIVGARKGISGGYHLERNPNSISLKEIIDIFEEPPMMRCLRSSNSEKFCPLVKTCPSHRTWAVLQERVAKVFGSVNIAKL